MTDNEIAICKEIICDLNTYCALTPAAYKPMGFEFQENDFICLNNLIELINRQKAEIERLKRYDEERDIALHARLIANAKTEAIREFAEKIKVHCNEIVNQEWNKKTSPVSWSDAYEDFIDDIDNLVKEMTEECNDQQKT